MDILDSASKEAFEDINKSANVDECLDEESEDEDNSDNEDFYFESDHLALRGNPDYRSVLRTIVILEAQRIEAAKHIDRIAQVKIRAMQDPEEFIKVLAMGDHLDLPGPINIQNVRFSIQMSKLDILLNCTYENFPATKNQV